MSELHRVPGALGAGRQQRAGQGRSEEDVGRITVCVILNHLVVEDDDSDKSHVEFALRRDAWRAEPRLTELGRPVHPHGYDLTNVHAQSARSRSGGDEFVATSWVCHPTDDSGSAVLVEIEAVDTADRVDGGAQIRRPVSLERHDADANPTLDQLHSRKMRDLARQRRQVVIRKRVVGDSVRRHREGRRVRARQKGWIRRLGPSGRRDRPHGNPAEQADE